MTSTAANRADTEALSRRVIRQLRSGIGPLFAALVIICIALSIASPEFLTTSTLTNIMVQVSVVGIAAVGGKPVAVPAGALDQLNAHSAISVDGTLLAVTEAAKGRRAVYTLPAGGGTPVRLTRQDAQFEAWTPDGGLLLSGKRKKKETFFKVGLPGGSESPVQLGAGTNANPVYSPDGKFIYFDSDRSGSRQIWRMAADGTGAEQITTDEFLNSTPRVSPDGLQVAFLSVAKGGPGGAETDMKVRSVILATKAVRVISNMVGGVGSLGSAPWSPDGRTLAYVSYQLAPE